MRLKFSVGETVLELPIINVTKNSVQVLLQKSDLNCVPKVSQTIEDALINHPCCSEIQLNLTMLSIEMDSQKQLGNLHKSR